ncbi:hypothetical protein [Dysgonomonas termitidis]|uniref:Uncharacterized protein n=1 Tax=Dysgonomonas termitidis TaxID=1516126 RepID=A0ABV9KRB1_9BACT
MIKTIEDVKRMEPHEQRDWKFGLCIRNVIRVSEDLFTIDDTSHGWITAEVTLEQFEQLFKGELSIT